MHTAFRYLPFHSCTVHTQLSPDAALGVIRENVQAKKNWLAALTETEPRYFSGKVVGNQFSVERIIQYRNSFLPRVEGVIMPDTAGRGSLVRISMELPKVTLAFLTVWFCILGMFLMGILSSVIAHGGEAAFMLLWPIFMGIFAAALTLVCFWYEANLQEKKLRSLRKISYIIEVDDFEMRARRNGGSALE